MSGKNRPKLRGATQEREKRITQERDVGEKVNFLLMHKVEEFK